MTHYELLNLVGWMVCPSYASKHREVQDWLRVTLETAEKTLVKNTKSGAMYSVETDGRRLLVKILGSRRVETLALDILGAGRIARPYLS